jgi:hypothetical protein
MIQDRDIPLRRSTLCKQRLDVFSVDLDVSPAASHIFSMFILQNHQTAALQILRDLVQALGNCQQQIISDNPFRIFSGIFHVI